MAPELLTTMEANELRELGSKIRDWQTTHELSDAELCRRFGELGHTKTFKKIIDNQLEELDLERQLNNYRTAWALMESDGGEEREDGETYADLYATIVLNRVFAETRREKGLARCIFLIGPSSTGKTEAQKYLRDKHGPRIISVRATVAWSDSPMSFMAAILERLGVKNPPGIQSERFTKVVEKLNETRRAVFIEDAHHLGPRCLALIISLIDETPGEFLISAVDRLWTKIQSRAYQEIEQLRLNRLAEKIVLGDEVRERDVQKLLERRVNWEGEAAPAIRKVLPLLLEKAKHNGRLALVRETIKRVNDKCGADPVSPEVFVRTLDEEVKSR